MKNDSGISIGIIGAGLMGHRRADAIRRTGRGTVRSIADNALEKAVELAAEYTAKSSGEWRDVVEDPDVEALIVAVPNRYSEEIVRTALASGKHVLCEKPLGATAAQAQSLCAAAQASKGILRVGFNHRFHPSLLKAKELIVSGAIGDVITMRGRYGHGGRLGMEKEWRFQREVSGGGELIDQGVHLIDLARWLGGEFTSIFSLVETKFWEANVEDNAFVCLSGESVTMQFHVSVTNWKNIFSFEIFGKNGFLSIEGLGGSYGPERLTWGRRKPEFGVPDMDIFEFDTDTSWDMEWRHFCDALEGRKSLCATAFDGFAANHIVERAYESSRQRTMIPLTYSADVCRLDDEAVNLVQ